MHSIAVSAFLYQRTVLVVLCFQLHPLKHSVTGHSASSQSVSSDLNATTLSGSASIITTTTTTKYSLSSLELGNQTLYLAAKRILGLVHNIRHYPTCPCYLVPGPCCQGLTKLDPSSRGLGFIGDCRHSAAAPLTPLYKTPLLPSTHFNAWRPNATALLHSVTFCPTFLTTRPRFRDSEPHAPSASSNTHSLTGEEPFFAFRSFHPTSS